MLLKSGFSGLLTSNGIGTTEIGPPPMPHSGQQQQQQVAPHQHQASVIGASVSTFKAHPPPSPNLSNGSPMRNTHVLSGGVGAGGAANQQQQFASNLSDPLQQQIPSSPLSSFKMNHFQKNGSSTLFAIVNRSGGGAGNGTLAVNCSNNFNNGNTNGGPPSHSSTDSSSDCGVNLINPEVGKLKSVPQHQQMPFPGLPQKSLYNHNIQSQAVHQQQHQAMAVAYLHNNNGLDIDQQPQFVSTIGAVASGVAVKEELPPIDCFSMTNHQRHDEIQLLNQIQDKLKEGWTVHLAENGRLYYCNHISRLSSWLPPIECWVNEERLPYGWEQALDQKGRPYFINHLNKTTTYELPHFYSYDEPAPEPRCITLERHPTMGFGFVAGSEKPVIVRFVTEGSPSVNKLEPGDHILSVNGEDVKEVPRDHVIQLVRSCDSKVTLVVCQPSMAGTMGRKSTFLSAGKKAKLRTRPSRVRFAESVCVNGAPLFPPSAFSLGDLCVPPMANVLKVFLENGQTKSFKYDTTTTVADVVTSLKEKLCLTAIEHFSLVLEHVKSLKRNKLTLLDYEQTLVKIASRPGAHKLRCLFRITFVPTSAATIAQTDLNALDYLFMQCCNDVTQERFSPELQPDVALRLAALHIHQHILSNNLSPAKCTIKNVEQEFGLERFVPSSLMDGMKRKELRRLISHFMKLNAQMTGSTTKTLTQLQAKIHYLDIISTLPSYGAKCFSTNQRDGIERVLLVSPRFGLSQITGVRNAIPQQICTFDDMQKVVVHRDDDVSYSVFLYLINDAYISFSMDDRDAIEFALVLVGYFRLLTDNRGELELDMMREQPAVTDENAPPYLSQHSVCPSPWSYISPASVTTPTAHQLQSMAFSVPPPYHSIQLKSICSAFNGFKPGEGDDEFGFDLNHQLVLADDPMLNGQVIVEAKNDEVLRRVAEMQQLIDASQQYLTEQTNPNGAARQQVGQQQHPPQARAHQQPGEPKLPVKMTMMERDSDCDSMNSSKLSSNEDGSGSGSGSGSGLKHSDSLTLLAECISSQDLSSMISKDLSALLSPFDFQSAHSSAKTHPGQVTAQHLLQLPPGSGQSARKMQDLNQLLQDISGVDHSQSESDSESIYSPSGSPMHRTPSATGVTENSATHSPPAAVAMTTTNNKPPNSLPNSKVVRSSFGLHSPDSNLFDSANFEDAGLKEYFRKLKEASGDPVNEKLDKATKKLSEYYGFDIDANSIIETDPDLIDLTAITPPHTPDELDALTVLEAVPTGFGDHHARKGCDELDSFLAKVIIEPPAEKVTPAKELTPEEILAYIIPPPPGAVTAEQSGPRDGGSRKYPAMSGEPECVDKTSYNGSISDIITKFNNGNNSSSSEVNSPVSRNSPRNSIGSNGILHRKNSLSSNSDTGSCSGSFSNVGVPRSPTIIEYPTIDKKGTFSCCGKKQKDGDEEGAVKPEAVPRSQHPQQPLTLPPKKVDVQPLSPVRPPKSSELSYRCPALPNYQLSQPQQQQQQHNNQSTNPFYVSVPSSPQHQSSFLYSTQSRLVPAGGEPPVLPPRFDEQTRSPPSLSMLPPKKPPLPPLPQKPVFVAGGGLRSPPILHGPPKAHEFERTSSFRNNIYGNRTDPDNGFFRQTRSNSDCPSAAGMSLPPGSPPVQPRVFDVRPNVSYLFSPQLPRRIPPGSPKAVHFAGLPSNTNNNNNSSTVNLNLAAAAAHSPPIINGGGEVNVEALLAKTDVAMAGLLVKLDQVAAMCSVAQSAGGGVNIDDGKFEMAREALTDEALSLVTSSKQLVVTLSNDPVRYLPEHLTSCLTSLRRITELAQDMTKHTSAPLQTRNIVLKIHDVASSFRELVAVKSMPSSAGQLALQAECLANVLATLLRSLRVFSP